ncbi:MAG: TolC family protein [Pedobacter sp.]|nr:TolC family protein [Pedobacter sp.]
MPVFLSRTFDRYALAIAALIFNASVYAAPLSFIGAEDRLYRVSPAMAAAGAEVDRHRLMLDATSGLYLPRLSLHIAPVSYSKTVTVDPNAVLQSLPLTAGLPSLPLSSFDVTARGTGIREFAALDWLIYSGGKVQGERRVLDGNMREAEAESRQKREELGAVLVERYFGLALAERVRQVRAAVMAGLTQHREQALKLEQAGLISKAERLHAEVAFDDARRQLRKAESDRDLAARALGSLLDMDDAPALDTPLFVMSAPLPPLQDFQQAARKNNPVFAQLQAKQQQAAGAGSAARAGWRPQVTAFGAYQFNRDPLSLIEPDWVVGMDISFALFDHIDRSKSVAATERLADRIRLLGEDADEQIGLLVEKRYRETEIAREQYQLLESSEALATENLRLRTLAFREGQATSLDVVDAELMLAKTRTERAAMAYDFTQALSRLLASCGQSVQFRDYLARADIHLTQDVGTSPAKELP